MILKIKGEEEEKVLEVSMCPSGCLNNLCISYNGIIVGCIERKDGSFSAWSVNNEERDKLEKLGVKFNAGFGSCNGNKIKTS